MEKQKEKPTYQELKHQLGGLLTSNNNYRKQVIELKNRLKDRDASLEDLTLRARELTKRYDEQKEKYYTLERSYDAQSNLFTKLQNELSCYKRGVETFNELPWYKRIFKRIVTEQ